MKILGIIPARGGSKRLPGKNLADLGGKPLIQWTIDAAVESKAFDKLVVSSDDEEIGKVAGEYWLKRSENLADDDASTLSVVLDVFNKHSADIVVTLQPTSPFRTADDIVRALEFFKRMKADAVTSVVDAPHDYAFSMNIFSSLKLIPGIVRENGAIYIIKGECLERGESWYDVPLYGYLMPRQRSIDIDLLQDLELARMLVRSWTADEHVV